MKKITSKFVESVKLFLETFVKSCVRKDSKGLSVSVRPLQMPQLVKIKRWKPLQKPQLVKIKRWRPLQKPQLVKTQRADCRARSPNFYI